MTTAAVVKKAPPGRRQGTVPGAASPVTGGQGTAQPAQSDGKTAPAVPPSRRRGVTPLTPMRAQAAQSMRRLAKQVQDSHGDLTVHQHLRDAARVLESGNEEGAQRHLRAAAFALSPQSLMRNGHHTDDAHQSARSVMHGVHRHLLLVKDIVDAGEKNQRQVAKDSYGDDSTAPPQRDPNNGYGPGALAQKPTARQPPGDQALNAPAKSSSGGSDPAVADPVGVQPRGSKQFTTRDGVHAVTELAYGWDDLSGLLDLSAQTAALESTPALYGKPGGPGLYGVAGNKHSDYYEQLVQAFMTKRGMDKGRASATAWSVLRKWAAGGGGVHPEVQAAAQKALEQEGAASAKAHAHAVTWDDHLRAVELATVLEFFNPAQTRVAAGSATGGQFAPAGASGQQSQQQGKGKQPAKPDAHQQHLAHLAHLAHLKAQGKSAPAAKGGSAQKKAALLKQAAGYRTQADALIKQRDTLRAELASASGKTSSGQSGSTTSKGASTTSSTAPKTAANAAPGTAAAKASTTPAASTTPSASSASSGKSTSSASVNTAQVKAQIAQLNTQITGLQAQYKQAVAAAAKL